MSLPSLFDYLPEAEAWSLLKQAEEEKQPKKPLPKPIQAGLIIGTGLLGLSAGTLAGYGMGHLAERLVAPGVLHNALRAYAPTIGALAGSLGGAAYGRYKAREQEALQHVLEGKFDRPSGRVPAK